jgi:signal peptidase I
MSRRLKIVALALVGVLVVGGLGALLTAATVFRLARIEGHAMGLTLRDQDRVCVYMLAYRGTLPKREDIVMLRYPLDPSRRFVKRVVGLPGERLEIRGGQVFINDRPYDDAYVVPEFRSRENWGPELVPEGHYFVLGDRRNNSSDSRHWGFVPAGYLLGRVAYRWWPIPEARGF